MQWLRIGIACLGVIAGACQAAAEDGPYPELFGEGVFTGGEVFRGAFTPDGSTFYFFKKVTPGKEDYRIFASRLEAGKWSEPEKVVLGGDFSNTYPTISKDGSRMVFASSRPAPGMTKENYYLWQVERKRRDWGAPMLLTELNADGYYHSWPEFGDDGLLYFRRNSPDWRSRETLVARWEQGRWIRPVNDGAIDDCHAQRPELRIQGGSPGPGGSIRFLDVSVPSADAKTHQADIWICERRDGRWTSPRPLGPGINTGEMETFPFYSPDRKQLYFVRGFRSFYRVALADALRSAGAGNRKE